MTLKEDLLRSVREQVGVDRLTATISTLIGPLEARLADTKTAAEQLRQSAERVVATLQALRSGGAAPAAAVQASAQASAQAAAPLPVRIVPNQAPLPVASLGGAVQTPAQAASGSGGGSYAGAAQDIANALLQGRVNETLQGVHTILRTIDPALRNALNEVRTVIGALTQTVNAVFRGTTDVVGRIFTELTTAGVLPVSSLFANLLVFLDAGSAILVARVAPLLDRVEGIVSGVTTYVSDLVASLGSFLAGLINGLTTFFPALINATLYEVYRVSIYPALVGALGFGLILIEALTRVIDDLVEKIFGYLKTGLLVAGGVVGGILLAVNPLAALLGAVVGALSYVAVKVFGSDPTSKTFGEQISDAQKRLSENSDTQATIRGIVESTLGPQPPAAGALENARFGLGAFNPEVLDPGTVRDLQEVRRLGFPVDFSAGYEPYAVIPGFTRPTFRVARAPAAGAPAAPAAGALAAPARAPAGSPAAVSQAAPARDERPAITVNGGINVQITAPSVDGDSIEGTARAIAEKVYEERRITEQERFRRGLPTGSIA